jgi:hypothetical protein
LSWRPAGSLASQLSAVSSKIPVRSFTAARTVCHLHQDNLERTDDEFYLSFRLQFSRLPEPEWGVVVGDVVQDLRAVLDYLVWGLVVQERGTRSAEAPAQDVAFPIAKDPQAVNDASARYMSATSEPEEGIDPRADLR